MKTNLMIGLIIVLLVWWGSWGIIKTKNYKDDERKVKFIDIFLLGPGVWIICFIGKGRTPQL